MKKIMVLLCCLSLMTVGCGLGGVSGKDKIIDKSVDEDVENINSEEEGDYDEYTQIDEICTTCLKAIQYDLGSDLNGISVESNIANLKSTQDESSIQSDMYDLKKTLQRLYGANISIDYEKSSYEEFDVEKIKNAIDDDEGIDIIESLDKTIEEVIESGCNFQRFLKIDITFKISGDKGDDTQVVPVYIYKIDGVFYTDTYTLWRLYEGQKDLLKEKEEVEELKRAGEDYSFSTSYGEHSDLDVDYSSLLLTQ